MALEKMKKTLIDTELQLFREHGLVSYPEVIVECWDPYALTPEKDKIFMLLTDATLRFQNGEVTIDTLKRASYIDEEKAKILIKGLPPLADKIPFHAIEHTDVYATKLEADLMQKPTIIVPEKIEAAGGVVAYNTPILQSLISEALSKFAKNRAATAEQIITYLTTPYPHGGGWYKRTATLIINIKNTLQIMNNLGLLSYDEDKNQYILISKSTTSQLRR